MLLCQLCFGIASLSRPPVLSMNGFLALWLSGSQTGSAVPPGHPSLPLCVTSLEERREMYSQALIKSAPWQQMVRAVAQEINELLAWLNVSPAVTSSFALLRARDRSTLIHLRLVVCFFFPHPQIQMLSGVGLERGFNHLKG